MHWTQKGYQPFPVKGYPVKQIASPSQILPDFPLNYLAVAGHADGSCMIDRMNGIGFLFTREMWCEYNVLMIAIQFYIAIFAIARFFYVPSYTLS